MASILLVEDDPFILDIYREKFVAEGFTVDIATDGQMALEKINHAAPDVLLLDVLLPKLDGWEVLKTIRQNPALKNLKVIIISNLNRQDFEDNIAQLKVSKYFLKITTTPEEIANAIKEMLR